MRIPCVQCIRLALYSASHGGNHYCTINFIWSALVFESIDQIILLTLSRVWGCPPRPYTCHTFIVSHPLMGTKIHHALAPEAPPLDNKFYDVHWPYIELFPSHIRGKYFNPKISPHSFQWPTPPKHTTSQHSFHSIRPSMNFHLTPTPPKEPMDEEKG